MNLKKRAMQFAAVLLSLAVLLPSAPAAFASQSAAEGTAVVFSESGITAADESGLSIDGTTLTIEQAGTYVLSGICSDGSVKVKKGVTGVTLVLSGLDLTSSTTAPITCGKSSGVTILAAGGTENALTDAAANNGDNYPDNADGTITVSGGTVFAAGGSAGMGMTLSASQPYVTFGTQASQPGQGGRQAPGGQQDGSTPPSMPDGQSGSQPQQPGGAQATGTQRTPPEKPQGSTDGSSAPEPPTGGGQPGQDAQQGTSGAPDGQGGQGGMAQPGGVSSLGIQSGSAVTVQDADGNTLFDGKAPCAVSTVFYSSPDLTDGETATLTSDGESVATASTDSSGTSQTITPAAQTAAAASSQKWLVLRLVTAAGVAAVVGAAIAVKKSKKKD